MHRKKFYDIMQAFIASVEQPAPCEPGGAISQGCKSLLAINGMRSKRFICCRFWDSPEVVIQSPFAGVLLISLHCGFVKACYSNSWPCERVIQIW